MKATNKAVATLTYEFNVKPSWGIYQRPAAFAIPIGRTQRASLRQAARSLWRTYLSKNHDEWYTYAYAAHRLGLLTLPRSISGGVEAVFEAHELSGDERIDRSARIKLNTEGFRIILVQGNVKAATWVTGIIRGSGHFVATIKVPQPVIRPGALRRQSSRKGRSQLEVRLQSTSDSISMKWYSGPFPRYKEDVSHEPKNKNEKDPHRTDEKTIYTAVPTEALFIEATPAPSRVSPFARWRAKLPICS
jgi:hypothetical protein